MTIFLTVLHVMVCLVLVVVVLLQHRKGADIGAVFGASNTVFGSRGAGNFLTRLTTGAALLFMVTSLLLSYIANTGVSSSLFDEDAPPPGVVAPTPAEAPAEAVTPGGFEEIPAPDAGTAAPEGASATEGAAAAPSAQPQAPVAEPSAPAGEPAEAGEQAPATP